MRILMKKSSLPIDFQIMARVGDAILNTISLHLWYHGGIPGKYKKLIPNNNCHQYLQSNDFICKYNLPKVKYKHLSLDNPKLDADKVEAYLAFLYLNYGYKYTYHFVRKQSFRILDQQLCARK